MLTLDLHLAEAMERLNTQEAIPEEDKQRQPPQPPRQNSAMQAGREGVYYDILRTKPLRMFLTW